MVENWKRRLKRKLKGLSEEEKAKKIKDILLEEDLSKWRRHCLAEWRKRKEGDLGNFW